MSNIKQFLQSILEKGYGLPRLVDTLAILLAFVYMNNIFRLTPQLPSSIFYILVILLNLSLLALCSSNGITISGFMWLFWLFMWLSVFMSEPVLTAYFKSYGRTLSFFIVMLIVAPWFTGKQLILVRERIFDTLNLIALFMADLSFVGRFLHFLPYDRQGFYLGCTYHSMNLAALSGIAAVYSIHKFFLHKDKRLRIFFGCSFFGCLLVILLSASRTVLISCIIAVLSYFALGASQSIQKITKPAIIIFLLIYCISIILPNAFSGLRKKSSANTERYNIDTFMASRREAWLDRIDEIKENPLFGTGAHTIKYGQYEKNGQIEPGNAWLYIFSSMGIGAFIVFCSIIYNSYSRNWKFAHPGNKVSLILSMLTYFCFYMVGESHITAAGEFTCYYFWLIISEALYHINTNDNLVAKIPC